MIKCLFRQQLRATNNYLFSEGRKHGARCLVLHPVTYPNKGPVIEQYLAQEAIGLVSSLNWEVVRGPFWNSHRQSIDQKYKHVPANTLYMEPEFGSQIKDGTYVKTNLGKAVYVQGGLMFDDEPTESDGDLHHEWQNKNLRESLANASLVKCKKTTQKYFFTKGKLEKLVEHIVSQRPSCIFINTELKAGQVRNLKKLIQSQLNNKSPPKGYLSGSINEENSQTQFQSTEQQKQVEQSSRRSHSAYQKIQIFDRFSIILQIFAQRTTSKLAKLQIELSYLAYLKTRLVRDGSTYSSNLNLFTGNLLNASETTLQIISAKQRRAIGVMSGEGESQLEIERRNIKNKEAKIKKEIQIEEKLRQNKKQKDKNKYMGLPIIALVGYTNVGKSAFMNFVMGKNQVESKDLLFQTLKTTSRFVQLPSGTKAMLLDTIGFITDLPIQMIDSFKATLEDISHADLVIHLRDASHPQNQLQKQSVIAILKELKFNEEFYQSKMLEVWNKIDIALDLEVAPQNFSPEDIRVSCVTGQNMTDLLIFIEEKLKKQRGLTKRSITYGFERHEKIQLWLKMIANLPHNINYIHHYEKTKQYPKGSVTLELEIDEATYSKLEKYLDHLNGKEYIKDKSRKGMPPAEGW